jgi:chromosome partitioning protein
MNVLLKPERVTEAIAKGVLPRLDVLPGSPMLVNIDRTIGEVPDRDQRLRQALALVQTQYDFVIMDCPPSLGLLTRSALRASDGIIVPIQTEYYAMEGLSQILSAIKAARDPKTGRPELEGILFTMFDPRLSLSKEVVADVRSHLHDKVYDVKIPRDVALGEAPSFGKCIYDYDLRSRGAWAYLEFTKEVLDDRG